MRLKFATAIASAGSRIRRRAPYQHRNALYMSLTPSDRSGGGATARRTYPGKCSEKTLGYDDRRIAALAEAGAFGKAGNTA